MIILSARYAYLQIIQQKILERNNIKVSLKSGYYKVQYTDNDEEELTLEEIQQWLKAPKQDSTTRHERMEK